jgi:glucose/arabinose dehydrogenase
VTHAGDGSGRLFVVEKAGRIRILKNGVLETTPFLDIRSRVLSTGSEQGLFSVAFPPDYASKGYFYVDYTAPGGGAAGHTVVSRFRLTGTDVADPNSEEVLLTIAQPYANHNGGQIAFGPDGYLYVGMGDGGSGGDPENRAQNPAELLGKLMRLNVESGAGPYTPEIWALGLRNPWRFSFDRSNGDLYLADVGQSSYEEVNYLPVGTAAGTNFGWNRKEGTHCYPPSVTSCDSTGLTDPVAEYPRSGGCSVTGGFVYRGPTYSRMLGMYFYGDYCSGRIWGLKRDDGTWTANEVADTTYNISSFGEDEMGRLYLTDFAGGAVYELNDPTGPQIGAFRNLLPWIRRNANL